MKKLLAVTTTALMLSGALYADSNFYGKVALGYEDANNITNSNYNIDAGTGVNTMMAIGYRYKDFAIEGEYSHSKVNYNNKNLNYKNDITVNSYIVNALYYIDLKSVVTPYLGVGIGTSAYDDGISTDNVRTYEGTAGIAIAMNKSLDITAEYKYRKFDVKGIGTNADPDTSTNSYMLGLLYKF
ncbi:outer membrane beta-barrel protein [Sulfurimonas sp. HSL-1716]|uniref:outer membrane beta-barrel protein n=1 Tax=Hydrocurvibacter sulfurireducens TaxID=3131937 RepID=UPI0031F781C9